MPPAEYARYAGSATLSGGVTGIICERSLERASSGSRLPRRSKDRAKTDCLRTPIRFYPGWAAWATLSLNQSSSAHRTRSNCCSQKKGYEPRATRHRGKPKRLASTVYFAKLRRLKIASKSVPAEEAGSRDLAAIARRVCWWEPAASTLANTPLFLCRIMALGTWDDACIALEHYGRNAFREALQNAPPSLFDPRSWHYWHHRLELLPVPSLPERAIPA